MKLLIKIGILLFPLLSFAGAKEYFALSSSGGISLGSYQAGRLYYQNYFLMINGLAFSPSVFTGASAGSINSLLSLIDICQNRPKNPQDSLYWKTWIPIGLKSLVPKKDGTPTALFSNKALLKIGQEIKSEWLKGFDEKCTMYLGIPITLKTPDIIQLGPSLAVQRQLISLVLKISGNGVNVPPTIENMKVRRKDLGLPRLYIDPKAENQFDSLSNVLLASTAFPGAFPPQKVRVCLSQGSTCTFEESQELEFIDGGIYENQPIKLSYLITKGLGDNEKKPSFYRHVDADGRGYPSENQGPADKGNSFLKTIMHTSLSFMHTSRNQELYSFIQEFPKIKENIVSTVSQFPRASDPWGAFFGFFDDGFREFDFLLGIYESEQETSKISHPYFKSRPSYTLNDQDISIKGSWRRYACLRQYLNGTSESQRDKICHDPSVKNLLILSQISLWRLYGTCHKQDVDKKKWVGCEALSHWQETPLLSGEFKKKMALPEYGQDTGDYFLHALETLGYEFDSKEFNKQSPIDEQLRLKLQVLLDKLASRQKGEEKRAVRSLGTVALNFYRYLSPERSVYATLGELSELGFTTRKFPFMRQFDQFSFNVALQTFRGQDVFKGNDNEATIAPLVGGIFPLTSISNGRIQYSLGAGVGNIFSIAEMRGSSCDDSRTLCKGLFLRPIFGVSFMNLFQANLYQRINLSESGKKSDVNLSFGFNYSF